MYLIAGEFISKSDLIAIRNWLLDLDDCFIEKDIAMGKTYNSTNTSEVEYFLARETLTTRVVEDLAPYSRQYRSLIFRLF